VIWAIGVMAPEAHADVDMACIIDMWAALGTGVAAPEVLVDVVDGAKAPERKSAPKSVLLVSLGVLGSSGGGSNGSWELWCWTLARLIKHFCRNLYLKALSWFRAGRSSFAL